MLAVGHPSSMLTKTSKARFGVILTNNLSRDPYGIFSRVRQEDALCQSN